MFRGDPDRIRAGVERLLAEDRPPPPDDLSEVARAVSPRRDAILALAARHATPFYAWDPEGFRHALDAFRAAFDAAVPRHAPHYAVKSNHHPAVVQAAVSAGYGLDVSSGRELRQALALPVARILFSGPGKSADDLALAAAHADRVIVQLDSEGELARLSALGRPVRAGLRFHTGAHGAWSKFGVPLSEVGRIWRRAAALPGVELVGLQSHLSWNRSPAPYVAVIEALGDELARWSAEDRARLAFVSVGGGFRPHRLEGAFPSELPLGAIARAVDEVDGERSAFAAPYVVKPSVPVSAYAAAIGAAVRAHLPANLEIFSEPGRIVSTHAMHLVMRVVDKKSPNLVILDGGVHMVGWEKYQVIYCPVVDLTHPADTELEVVLGGSLCDSEDTFGERIFASAVEEGDVIVVPFQGAYSWATAQSFIRPIPEVHGLGDAR